MRTAEMELDSEAVFVALDQKRRQLKLRRKDVAAELGVAACTVTYWRAGGKLGSDAVLRACIWLGRDIADFIKQGGAADR